MNMNDFPQLALNEKHGATLAAIFGYLEENGLTIVEAEKLYDAEIFVPYGQTVLSHLYKAVGIDETALEAERRALLAGL